MHHQFPTISQLMLHVFGHETIIHPTTNEKIPTVELGYDYMQLLLTQPSKCLPILVLCGGPGKSTFASLCSSMLPGHVLWIDSADLWKMNYRMNICDEAHFSAADLHHLELANAEGMPALLLCTNSLETQQAAIEHPFIWVRTLPDGLILHPSLYPYVRKQLEAEIENFRGYLLQRTLASTIERFEEWEI